MVATNFMNLGKTMRYRCVGCHQSNLSIENRTSTQVGKIIYSHLDFIVAFSCTANHQNVLHYSWFCQPGEVFVFSSII